MLSKLAFENQHKINIESTWEERKQHFRVKYEGGGGYMGSHESFLEKENDIFSRGGGVVLVE